MLAFHSQRYSVGLVLVFILSFMPLCPALAQNAGEVVSALGTVEAQRDGRWQPVRQGTALMPGDTVRTGAGSRAAILLASGTQLKLNALSRLELKHIAPPPEGFLDTTAQTLQNILRVLSGEVWVRNSGEPLEIQTVPATATIRGTEFNLAVEPQDSARLAVVNGLVEFSNPQGSVMRRARRFYSIRSMRCSGRCTTRPSPTPVSPERWPPPSSFSWKVRYPPPGRRWIEPWRVTPRMLKLIVSGRRWS